jgi:hypothetical protein
MLANSRAGGVLLLQLLKLKTNCPEAKLAMLYIFLYWKSAVGEDSSEV